MRRRTTTVIVISTMALLGAVVYAQPVATVLTAHGDVTAVRGGIDGTAVPGMELEAGDRVAAGANGSAALLLANGATVRVDANTAVTIPGDDRSSSGGALRGLWQNVLAKFSDSESTHAALGTVGAVRGEGGEALLEDYDYFTGDAEAHAADIAALDSALASGDIEARTYHLLSAVAAEYYERYSTAEAHYVHALSDAGRAAIDSTADVDAPAASMLHTSDRHVLRLMADLYARNDYFERAAELAAIATH